MCSRLIRFLANIVAVLAVLLPISSGAVSLGDELVMSRLGDPVEVEIEVLQWQDLDMDRVQISVGTAAEYEAFGLERLPVLDSLRFNLVGPDGAGRLILLVSNREPIEEPFLDLLMAMRWPGGSLLREYILLFDPPGVEPPATQVLELSGTGAGSSQAMPAEIVAGINQTTGSDAGIPVVEETSVPVTSEPVAASTPAASRVEAPAAGSQEPGPAPTIRNQVAIDVEPVATRLPPRVPSAEAGQTGRQRYQVKSGDSLWDIARANQQSNIERDLDVFLVSLHDLNRDAFINGNISLLKSGAVLQIPSGRDLSLVDRDAAQRIFDQRWEEGTQRYELALQGQALPLFSEAYDNNLLVAEAPAAADPVEGQAGMETAMAGSPTSPLLPASETRLTAPVLPVPPPVQQQTEAAPMASDIPDPAGIEPQSNMAAAEPEENSWIPVGQVAEQVVLTAQAMPGDQAVNGSVLPETPGDTTTEPVTEDELLASSPATADPLPLPESAEFGLPVSLAQLDANPFMSDITANVISIQQMLARRQERLDSISVLVMARDDAVNLANAELAALQNRLSEIQGASVTGLLTPENERTLALVLVMLTLLCTGMILRETSLIREREGYYS
jgi:FimV-like protein